MFCPNCGTNCGQGLYCGNCGTKLPAPAVAEALRPAHGAMFNCANEGVIFTNLPALARKVKSSPDTLRQLLKAYIDASYSCDIAYILIDVADYEWKNPEVKGHHTTLSPSSSWLEHADVLKDHYRFGRKSNIERSDYLFIIGGEDVIPMPDVPHYSPDPERRQKENNCIDSDIPYAYLLGESTFAKMRSGELFNFEQYFLVGRLPLPLDASLSDVEGYLRRSMGTKGRIRLSKYYGQVNLPWKQDGSHTVAPLRRTGLKDCSEAHKDAYVEYTDGKRLPVSENGMYLSYPVTLDNVSKIFDPTAELYYFNLHGSDAPDGNNFYGDYEAAISPHYIATAKSDNIVITEACFGGKFMKYDRHLSMLLSAITARTLLYLGSSRVAYGPGHPVPYAEYSDRIASVFVSELLRGRTAGEALFLARKSFFDLDSKLNATRLISIVEFNLFGDPYLRASMGDDRIDSGKSIPIGNVMTVKKVHTVSQQQCVYEAENTPKKPLSLLEQVRGAVDRNLMQIREVVNRELYEKYGVEPRQLKTIYKNRYSDGTGSYSFSYQKENSGKYEEIYEVETDMGGKITSIATSK